MTWPQALQEAIDQFADVFDPMERYEMLFEWSSDVNELPVDEWNDANMIHGCQSQAHVMCHLEEGLFYMRGGADAQIVQGLMAITCLAVNGRPPEEVVEIEPTFVDEMGLKASLTPSRSNGFLNMFNRASSWTRLNILRKPFERLGVSEALSPISSTKVGSNSATSSGGRPFTAKQVMAIRPWTIWASGPPRM